MTENISAEIRELAQSYYNQYTVEQLESMLSENLWKLGAKDTSATRGSGFWNIFREGLFKDTLQNRDTVAATIGFATSQALKMLDGTPVDVAAYKIIIAIAVAIVVRNVFKALEATQEKPQTNS